MPEDDFELYLLLLKRFLRISSAQSETIANELRDHLEQRLVELEARGLSREAALREALDEFGDAAELADHFTSLARTRKRRLIMRWTMSGVAALAAALLIATAFWPETPNAPLPPVARAQPQPATATPAVPAIPAAPRYVRRLVRLSHSPSASIALSLSKHLGGDSSIEVVSEAVSNSLLVKAPQEFIEEALALVKELDRPASSVAVDVAIVDVAIASGNARGLPQPVDPRDFEGPIAMVRTKLQDLIKAGHVQRFKRIHLLALDNQLTQSEDNEDRPESTPAAAAASGRPGAAYSRQRPGTTVSLTARVGSNGSAVASLVVRDTPRWPTGGAADGKDADSSGGIDANYQGTISMQPGRAMVVNSIERSSSAGRSQTLFIVSSEVIDPARERPVADAAP